MKGLATWSYTTIKEGKFTGNHDLPIRVEPRPYMAVPKRKLMEAYMNTQPYY